MDVGKNVLLALSCVSMEKKKKKTGLEFYCLFQSLSEHYWINQALEWQQEGKSPEFIFTIPQ